MGQPGIISFEPAYADELAAIMRYGFEYMQDEEAGGSVYLRLSTRPLDQPKRNMGGKMISDILSGGYWRHAPTKTTKHVIIYTGVLAQEASEAYAELGDTALLAVTSSDRLYNDWQDKGDAAHVFKLLQNIPEGAKIVTVLDGHPASLAWLGSVQAPSFWVLAQ